MKLRINVEKVEAGKYAALPVKWRLIKEAAKVVRVVCCNLEMYFMKSIVLFKAKGVERNGE